MQSAAVVVAQRSAGSAANVAVTVLAASISSAHVVSLPLQSPLQPVKVCVASSQLAVSVTCVPPFWVVVPVGLTVPPPVAVTASVYVWIWKLTLAVLAASIVSVQVAAVPLQSPPQVPML